MVTPIDKLKNHYGSSLEHLRAIANALMEQFGIAEDQRPQVQKAVAAAFHVGRSTTATDDWCDLW